MSPDMSNARIIKVYVLTCSGCPEFRAHLDGSAWCQKAIRELSHAGSLNSIPGWCPLPKPEADHA